MGWTLQRLETETFTAERQWESEGFPILSAVIALPQPVGTGSRMLRRIRRYYRAQARAYLRYCEQVLLPIAREACRAALENSTPMPHLQAELCYQVTYNEGGLWSLYTQSREPGEDGRYLLRRWGDTWDLRRGYPVELSRFFPPHSGWKRQLLALAAAEIQRQEAAGCARYRKDWRKRLRRAFHPMRFYLTEEGLVFFYPMYALAPAVEGIPAFLHPWPESEVPPEKHDEFSVTCSS